MCSTCFYLSPSQSWKSPGDSGLERPFVMTNCAVSRTGKQVVFYLRITAHSGISSSCVIVVAVVNCVSSFFIASKMKKSERRSQERKDLPCIKPSPTAAAAALPETIEKTEQVWGGREKENKFGQYTSWQQNVSNEALKPGRQFHTMRYIRSQQGSSASNRSRSRRQLEMAIHDLETFVTFEDDLKECL